MPVPSPWTGEGQGGSEMTPHPNLFPHLGIIFVEGPHDILSGERAWKKRKPSPG